MNIIESLKCRRSKIAVLHASRVGDFLCAVPALRALRQALPDSELSLIGLPVILELSTRCPYLDRHYPFPGFPGIAQQFFRATNVLNFLSSMQKKKFDLVIQMHGSGVYSNTFALLIGGGRTAGFIRPGDSSELLAAALPYSAGLHAILRYLALARLLGVHSFDATLEFPLTPADRRAAENLLPLGRTLRIGLHPGAADPEKVWPLERMAEAARILSADMKAQIILIGSQSEIGQNSRLREIIGPGAVDVTGRTSLTSLGAVLERLSLFITTDSGPAHISYAVGTPTLTIFGPTSPAEWGPLDIERHCAVEGNGRVNRVTVEEVLESAVRMLHRMEIIKNPSPSTSPFKCVNRENVALSRKDVNHTPRANGHSMPR